MTNEEINALTDPQINVMMTVAVKRIGHHKVLPSGDCVEFLDCVGVSDVEKVKDYCNDPAVMMPIAFENGIGYVSGDGMVLAMKINSAMENADGRIEINTDVKFIEYSDKVCRALAIVYLKSKGVL